ncbi:unnamed protein product [Pelagomonas calceolata]|uniref:Protein SirB1 N-terminal domain-containing protein n=1 Tax=Pelagomonas calceolata TaxID=35677 RepID=A0A8J2S741_9STRA|nr:unnamed protein product [Pelagomonas calceolata]
MEPTAKSSQKPAINDTSLLACLPEPVLELVLAAAGPRARMRSARCSRGVQDAALLPDKYWREAYTQRWWHARAALVPEKSAVAFAARVKGERACCDLLVALAESGNQLTWRQKNDCVERAGDDACELLARISAATNVYSEPHTPFGRARRSGLRPPPAPGSTAAWVAVVSPRAAQTLRACGQAGVVGNHARDLLTHAQTARLRNRWRPAPSLEEAAARVASAFRVFYDGEGVVKALEALAARVRAASASTDQLALIRATEAVLFDECGFRGVDADEYYAASNSFLDEVLRRRAGIPISLACLFVAVAERAGVKRGALRPVSAPGHFLLAFGDDDAFDDAADVFFSRAIFLDVFARHRGPRYGSLSFGQVAAFIARHVGVNEQQAALYLHDACKNYARPDEVGARCARNLMLIMENEERRSLAGSVGITHGVRPLAALDIYRQLENAFRNGGD